VTTQHPASDVHVDPRSLEQALTSLGWKMVHEEVDVYRRWRSPDAADPVSNVVRSTVLVPLDPSRGDYEELLHDAKYFVGMLTALNPKRVEQAYAEVSELSGDTLFFRKDTGMRAGRVPWLEGRVLFDSAEQTLLAAAKASVTRSAYFGNTHGAFARRFLDECVMGQTQVGSFIVTALTPVSGYFPESQSRHPKGFIVPSHSGRDITLRLAEALEAAQEAAEHYQSTGSISAFEDSVGSGVSREMTEALHSMVSGKFPTDVTVEWSKSSAPVGSTSPSRQPAATHVEFLPTYAEAFQAASKKLASMAPPQDVALVGWVSVISRPNRGESGVIRLQVLSGAAQGIMRVRVSDEQFEIAMESMRRQEALSVTGRLELKGKTRWVDGARVDLTEFPGDDEYE